MIVVRPAEPVDYPAVARLTVDAYQADGQLNDSAASYANTLADVAARAEAGALLVAVDSAANAPDVLGSVLFVEPGSQYAELSRAGEAEFRMLAVDPTAQGRGVGRALVQACVDRYVIGIGNRATTTFLAHDLRSDKPAVILVDV